MDCYCYGLVCFVRFGLEFLESFLFESKNNDDDTKKFYCQHAWYGLVGE